MFEDWPSVEHVWENESLQAEARHRYNRYLPMGGHGFRLLKLIGPSPFAEDGRGIMYFGTFAHPDFVRRRNKISVNLLSKQWTALGADRDNSCRSERQSHFGQRPTAPESHPRRTAMSLRRSCAVSDCFLGTTRVAGVWSSGCLEIAHVCRADGVRPQVSFNT